MSGQYLFTGSLEAILEMNPAADQDPANFTGAPEPFLDIVCTGHELPSACKTNIALPFALSG